MPLYRFDDRLVLFVHVPKTGGSSLEAALCAMGGRQAMFSETALPYTRCTPQHMHAALLEVFAPEALTDLRFALVRHPGTRLVSEYKMRRDGRGAEDAPLPAFDDWVPKLFARYRRNPYLHDNHIRPQNAFVAGTTRVFRFEDGLEAPLDWLAGTLGRSAPPLGHDRRSTPGPVAMTAQTRERIAAFYRADFRRFGYDPEIWPET